MIADWATSDSKNSVNFFHWTDSESVDVNAVPEQNWHNEEDVCIGIGYGINDHDKMQELVHSTDHSMDNMFEMMHVTIESVEDWTSWSDVKEEVYWGSNDLLKDFLMYSFHSIWNQASYNVLSNTVASGNSKNDFGHFECVEVVVIKLDILGLVCPFSDNISILSIKIFHESNDHEDS